MSETPNADLVRKAIESGNFKVDKGLADHLELYPIIPGAKFEFLDTKLSFWGKSDRSLGGMSIDWTSKASGTGDIVLYIDLDGSLKIQTQGMGKEFLLDSLRRIIMDAEVEY